MARRGENIRKRKDKRWEARVPERDENGKLKYRSLYAKSYTEVKAKQMEAMAGNSNLNAPSAKKLAHFDWLAHDWLDGIKHSVKESTYTRYHRIVQKYLIPLIGKTHVTQIDSARIHSLTDKLLNNGGKNGCSLSAKTVSDILSVLKLIFTHGSVQGYRCPDTALVRTPKQSSPDTHSFGRDDLHRLEAILWDAEDELSFGILFSLYTGVRIGELCGLRWGDIDWKAKLVHIRRTVERISDLDPHSVRRTKVVISEPKTDTSQRKIPLPAALMKYLKKRRKDKRCYLLTGTEKHTEPHTVCVRYTRYLKRHGFSKYTFHSLRHTFATRCAEAGFDTKSLSEILGHADVTTTLRSYVHPSMEQKRSQMEMLFGNDIHGRKKSQKTLKNPAVYG